MGIIQGILKEERDRLRRLKEKYASELQALPHQTVSVKKRNDREYVYLAERIKDQVKFTYIGPVTSQKAASFLDSSRKKIEFKNKLKKVNQDLKEIEKIVHD